MAFLDTQQASLPSLALDQIPDDLNDTPVPGNHLGQLGPLQLPELIFGAAPLSNSYNSDTHLASFTPFRTIRLALRYGIRAFDTSPYYGPSERMLGDVLKALEPQFPRPSYKLMTKCGRYGPDLFDYSPERIRASVELSLSRLNTTYLDSVCLHDVEFVCTPIAPRTTGNHSFALAGDRALYGLLEGEEGMVRGEADQKILDAIAELRKLQDEGLIKHIGITGYPVPTLLRLALLVLHTPPYRPLDLVLSYCHLNLQNAAFADFASQFSERAQVKQLLTASPLSMGLLTPTPPSWHPAPRKLHEAVSDARQNSKVWARGLPNLALGYALRKSGASNGNIPLVAGFSHPREVHECMEVWREVAEGVHEIERKAMEEVVIETFARSGFLNWSWASP